jgi:hypothetical protein
VIRLYFAINAGEGYFSAMETLHKRKQYIFRRTISQLPKQQTGFHINSSYLPIAPIKKAGPFLTRAYKLFGYLELAIMKSAIAETTSSSIP